MVDAVIDDSGCSFKCINSVVEVRFARWYSGYIKQDINNQPEQIEEQAPKISEDIFGAAYNLFTKLPCWQ